MGRLITLGFALLSLLAVSAGSASAQNTQYNWTGFYMGVQAGGGFGSSSWCTEAFTGVTPGCSDGENIKLSPSGWIGGGQVGGRYQNGNWVGGLEASLAAADLSDSTGCAVGGCPGRVRSVSIGDILTLTGQLGYAWDRYLPYLKAGYAGVPGKVAFAADNQNPGGFALHTKSDANGWIVGGGVEGKLLQTAYGDASLGLEYDYMQFNVPNSTGLTNSGGITSACSFCNQSLSVNQILLRVNWTFGVPKSPPPAVTPAVAAPPAPPPAAVAPKKQMFIVFFEFDKSSITPDGKKVVDAAAAAYKSGKSDVAIAGYTDLAGTQQYNLALSKRRADAVKAALVKDGVPAAAIGESWYGKQNPRVPTADGVREPQNRRVEITM